MKRTDNKVKKSSPKSLSADCWYTVSQLYTNSCPTENRHRKKKKRSVLILTLNPYRKFC